MRKRGISDGVARSGRSVTWPRKVSDFPVNPRQEISAASFIHLSVGRRPSERTVAREARLVSRCQRYIAGHTTHGTLPSLRSSLISIGNGTTSFVRFRKICRSAAPGIPRDADERDNESSESPEPNNRTRKRPLSSTRSGSVVSCGELRPPPSYSSAGHPACFSLSENFRRSISTILLYFGLIG